MRACSRPAPESIPVKRSVIRAVGLAGVESGVAWKSFSSRSPGFSPLPGTPVPEAMPFESEPPTKIRDPAL